MRPEPLEPLKTVEDLLAEQNGDERANKFKKGEVVFIAVHTPVGTPGVVVERNLIVYAGPFAYGIACMEQEGDIVGDADQYDADAYVSWRRSPSDAVKRLRTISERAAERAHMELQALEAWFESNPGLDDEG